MDKDGYYPTLLDLKRENKMNKEDHAKKYKEFCLSTYGVSVGQTTENNSITIVDLNKDECIVKFSGCDTPISIKARDIDEIYDILGRIAYAMGYLSVE